MGNQNTQSILRIGLTGGIASGKSLVAALFAAHGIPVIDTDILAREAVCPGQPALTELIAAFGSGILLKSGELDRARLRDLVFRDDALRQQLESILHPRIRAATIAACQRAGGPYQMVVVPLLVESGFNDLVDRVLVVDCPEAVQLERLVRRDGGSEAAARRILAAQADRTVRMAAADDIIHNDGDRASTEQQVDSLHKAYLALAQQR